MADPRPLGRLPGGPAGESRAAPREGGAATPTTAPSALTSRLGYAGLIPFVLGALLIWSVRPDAHPHVVDALAKYAAVIVSFLGGMQWGLRVRATEPAAPAGDSVGFLWGILASLAAWVAVVMPAYAGLVLQGLLLIACYAFDRRSYPALGAGGWLTLRFRLTAVASLSCFIAAAGS
jgi:hypothetical protein